MVTVNQVSVFACMLHVVVASDSSPQHSALTFLFLIFVVLL